MDTKDMIEVTGVDLKELVKAAYDLSKPQGLGYLHFEEGGLSDEEAEKCITDHPRFAVMMDYVKGRACKLDVFKGPEGRLFIQDNWFDHSEAQLVELLKRVGLGKEETKMLTATELATKAEESIKVLGSDRCFDNWDEILPLDDLVKDMGNLKPEEVLTFLREVGQELNNDEEAAWHLCHCIVHIMERDNEPLLDELYELDHAFMSHLYG